MRLTVLVDNNTLIDRYLLGEPGVCYLIEVDDLRVLFDVGYSDVFMRNAQSLGVDLLQLDYVVLSHGHLDHTWGLPFLIRLLSEAKIEELPHRCPKLVTHPGTFVPRSYQGLGQVGSIVSERELRRHFAVQVSREPLWLSENLVFLGEIERRNDFEGRQAIGTVGESGLDDYVVEDSALAYRCPDGLVVIVGCAHAGICNIVRQAQAICGDERVLDIIGGLHLLDAPAAQIQGTARFLGALHPRELHACHCTDLRAKIALAGVANLQEVGCGLRLSFP